MAKRAEPNDAEIVDLTTLINTIDNNDPQRGTDRKITLKDLFPCSAVKDIDAAKTNFGEFFADTLVVGRFLSAAWLPKDSLTVMFVEQLCLSLGLDYTWFTTGDTAAVFVIIDSEDLANYRLIGLNGELEVLHN